MTDEARATVGDLREAIGQFDDDDRVSVAFEGTPSMDVVGIGTDRKPGGEVSLLLVLPEQPTDDAVDCDMTRLCEKVLRGESTIFQVRFGMDVFRQCNADTPDKRLQALSGYFAEAKRRVDEMISFGQEAGRIAAEESS